MGEIYPEQRGPRSMTGRPPELESYCIEEPDLLKGAGALETTVHTITITIRRITSMKVDSNHVLLTSLVMVV